ncbi:MAG: phosphatidylserine decarboxylase [Planctomycetota bacterium]
MLSGYARAEWSIILLVGALLTISGALLGWWWLAPLPIVIAVVTVLFFRDPVRKPPSQRGAVVAVCDGRVSSIHDVEHFPPFDGPATCVRVFMSVFDVHLNRSPCHGKVAAITEQPGNFGNTLNPQSIEDNQSVTTLLVHPSKGHPVAAVRQVAGMLARTIHNALRDGQIVQRGQRMGIIKLGSTTELYLPRTIEPVVQVTQGQKVLAGQTVLASVNSADPSAAAVIPATRDSKEQPATPTESASA